MSENELFKQYKEEYTQGNTNMDFNTWKALRDIEEALKRWDNE